MRTARTRCQLIVLLLLAMLAAGDALAQPYWYKLTLSRRTPFAAVTIIFKVDNFITTDTWVPLIPAVHAYNQTWNYVYYGQSVDHNDHYLRLTRSIPPVDPPFNPADVAFSIEAYFATAPTTLNTPYNLNNQYDTTVWATNGGGFSELHGTGGTLIITEYNPPLVRMAQMWAEGGGHGVTVNWETASELGTAGFLIRRAEQDGGPYQVASDLIPAEGGPTQGAKYQWIDTNVVYGAEYYYLIEEVEDSGNTNTFGPINATVPSARRRR